MKVKLPVCFVFCVLFAEIKAKSVKTSNLEDLYGPLASADEKVQNDEVDYGLDDEEEPTNDNSDTRNNVSINAEFRSQPQNFTARLGDTLRLPCEVNNTEVILLWQKDDTLLYQGDIGFKSFPNIKKNGSYLEVTLNSEDDFGKYICKMIRSAEDNPVIVHTILHATAPYIIDLKAAEGKTVYKPGETLKLTCRATGHPKPKISWHKDNTRLDMEGETLIIEGLKFRDSGSYRCLADNKIEPPAHYNITINVEHKPIVSIEKYIVNSDKEYDVELKCTVHAYPAAIVVWKRNNMNIVSIPPKIKLEKHQNNVENILIIRNLTDEDFGQYDCSARNVHGKVEKTVNLVKTPTVQEVSKPEKMNKDVVLMWKVESKSPITEHELQYRKTGEEQWRNVSPDVTKGENNVYTVKYTLKNLDANSYEIRVRSRNVHGWSDFSDYISVEGVTAKNGSHHKLHNKKHHKEKNLKDKHVISSTPDTPAQENESIKSPVGTVRASEASGCTLPGPSTLVVVISIAFLFYHRQ